MNKPRTIMTKRTFGLLSTLSVLSIGIFTAGLVLAYPSPIAESVDAQMLSDTKSIDESRRVANTDSVGQSTASNKQAPVTTPSTGSSANAQSSTSTSQTAAMPANTPAQTNTPAQQSEPSTSQVSSSKQPSNVQKQTTPDTSDQPNIVTFVRDTIGDIVTLLPL